MTRSFIVLGWLIEVILCKSSLVVCTFHFSCIDEILTHTSDYVGAILGLVRDGSAWRLDPLQVYTVHCSLSIFLIRLYPQTMRQLDHEFSPQGQGNVVSIEFNLLYRWHATLSEQDAKWTEQEFSKLFKGRDFSTVRSRSCFLY